MTELIEVEKLAELTGYSCYSEYVDIDDGWTADDMYVIKDLGEDRVIACFNDVDDARRYMASNPKLIH